jgi:hypothetical protein
VRAGDDLFRIEVVFQGPLSPDARNRGCGIDKHSIHIEQERAADDPRHEQEYLFKIDVSKPGHASRGFSVTW